MLPGEVAIRVSSRGRSVRFDSGFKSLHDLVQLARESFRIASAPTPSRSPISAHSSPSARHSATLWASWDSCFRTSDRRSRASTIRSGVSESAGSIELPVQRILPAVIPAGGACPAHFVGQLVAGDLSEKFHEGFGRIDLILPQAGSHKKRCEDRLTDVHRVKVTADAIVGQSDADDPADHRLKTVYKRCRGNSITARTRSSRSWNSRSGGLHAAHGRQTWWLAQGRSDSIVPRITSAANSTGDAIRVRIKEASVDRPRVARTFWPHTRRLCSLCGSKPAGILRMPPTPEHASLDEAYRLQSSPTPPSLEELLERFPEVASDPQAVLDLIYHEIMNTEEAGGAIHWGTYRERFPHLADGLRDLEAVHQALDSASGNTQDPAIQTTDTRGFAASRQGPPPLTAESRGSGSCVPTPAEGWELCSLPKTGNWTGGGAQGDSRRLRR